MLQTSFQLFYLTFGLWGILGKSLKEWDFFLKNAKKSSIIMCTCRGSWVRQRWHVSKFLYHRDIQSEIGLQLGKACLLWWSLQQVRVEGECFYFFCFFTFIHFPLSPLSFSFISSTISSISLLPFSGRWHKMTHKVWHVIKPQHNQSVCVHVWSKYPSVIITLEFFCYTFWTKFSEDLLCLLRQDVSSSYPGLMFKSIHSKFYPLQALPFVSGIEMNVTLKEKFLY